MKLVITGGGTGGHIFPALAVGEEFMNLAPENQVLFVGGKGGMEERILAQEGVSYQLIRVGKFAGLGMAKKIQSLLETSLGLVQAMVLLKRFKPQVLLGMGGYVSVPVILAGFLLRIPRAIHEQNSYPGLANQLLSLFSQIIFLSFEQAKNYLPKPAQKKITITGNPIRPNLLAQLKKNQPGNKSKDKFRILVIGGSQGAKALNRLIKSALPYLEPFSSQIEFIHMSGKNYQEELKQAYREHNFSAQVVEFIDRIGEELKKADLVISRAGAGAVFELALFGKPSILIPYPYASKNHQSANARYLEEEGACWVFEEKELDGKKLASAIKRLFQEPELREKMSEQAKKLAKPEAGKIIAQKLTELGAQK